MYMYFKETIGHDIYMYRYIDNLNAIQLKLT